MREVAEISGGFRKVGWDRGLRAVKIKLQTQRRPGWNEEMIKENRMCRLNYDANLEMGEGLRAQRERCRSLGSSRGGKYGEDEVQTRKSRAAESKGIGPWECDRG
jgi:hypothetical protein